MKTLRQYKIQNLALSTVKYKKKETLDDSNANNQSANPMDGDSVFPAKTRSKSMAAFKTG